MRGRFGAPKPAHVNDASGDRCRYKYARPHFMLVSIFIWGHEGYGRQRYLAFKQLNARLAPFQTVQKQVSLKPQRHAGRYCPDSLPPLFPKGFPLREPVRPPFQQGVYPVLEPGVLFLEQPVCGKQPAPLRRYGYRHCRLPRAILAPL
jgi:hypothetical protein